MTALNHNKRGWRKYNNPINKVKFNITSPWKSCHVAYVIILSAFYKTLLFLMRAFRVLSNVRYFLSFRYPGFLHDSLSYSSQTGHQSSK